MGNRLSSYIPLAPEITKANIASQFPQDTIKVPLPEMTHSEKLEKAEFDTKQRKDLAKKKEALSDGSFPIRSESDLKNAIRDVGRSKNPAKAKAWIKKRSKDLDCEDCLPGSWEKATEDELNMFDNEIQKGGKGSGRKKLYVHFGNLEKLHPDDSSGMDTHLTGIGTDTTNKDLHYKGKEGKHHVYEYGENTTDEHVQNKLKKIKNAYPELDIKHKIRNVEKSIKPKIKKDMDGDGGGDEVEESVNKAFDNILGTEPDPIDKAFEEVIGVETDNVEKAFNNLLEKGGQGSGRKPGDKVQFKAGRYVMNGTYTGKSDKPGYHKVKQDGGGSEYHVHERSIMRSPEEAAERNKKSRESIDRAWHARNKKMEEKKALKDQNSYLDAKYRNHNTED